MNHEQSGPTPQRKRRYWIWAMIVVVASFGWGSWKSYDFHEAVKEARALGWDCTYNDPLDAIQQDWRMAFRKETWSNTTRSLLLPTAEPLLQQSALIYRLQPRQLLIQYAQGLRELSLLSGLSDLRELRIFGGLDLANVDALKTHTELRRLVLYRCPILKSVDALRGLSALEELNLFGCTGLTNVDALKGLRGLEMLSLDACDGFPPETNSALAAALPNTDIYSPYQSSQKIE